MVCDAVAQDINSDGSQDLLILGEWMPIKVFVNSNKQLVDESDKWLSTSTKGWWNCILSEDFDKDGDADFIAGNYGLNHQFGVSTSHPATLVYKDFNQDGQVDPFLTYYIGQQSFPYASRDEALAQVNTLRRRFPGYNSYSTATLETIFTQSELDKSTTLVADELKTVMLENVGGKFTVRELPAEVQFSPVYAISKADVDQDGDMDVVLGGNETMVRVRIGKSDANRGILLLNDGKGKFSYVPQSKSGFNLTGDVRQLLFVSSKDKTHLVVGETGMPVKSYVLGKD
jgi:hypothetical protein